MNMHVRSDHLELKSADDADTAVVTKAVDDLRAMFEQKSGETTKLLGRLDALETQINRINIGGRVTWTNTDDGAVEKKAFLSYARYGKENLGAEELKTLTVSTAASGGYLAPPDFESEIIKLLTQYSPIREYANVTTIGAAEVRFPRRINSAPTATWLGETAPRPSSEKTFEQLLFKPVSLGAYTDISNSLLEDNTSNLEGELIKYFAEDFGIIEGKAFVNGTGPGSPGQPQGLMTSTQITNVVKTGVANNLPASNPGDLVVVKMYHSIPTAHARNAVWLMNRNTMAVVRTWKDTTGQYLVSDLANGGSPILYGRPIIEAVDMPDIGAGTYPIMFGDLKGYRIVDRVGLSVSRDPFTQADNDSVRFRARKRTFADITNPDRFVKLQCSV